MTPQEHEELLALYRDASRNIESDKKHSLTYLASYSAAAFAIIALHSLSVSLRVTLLLAGAGLCLFMVFDAHKKLRMHKATLQRVFSAFTETFRRCMNPDDMALETITGKTEDIMIFCGSLIYPFIVLIVACIALNAGGE